MKEVDLTLKGVTHTAKNGRYDQLIVIMSVSEFINNETGDKQNFPIPPLVAVSVEPYRLVIPLNEKYALMRNGSEVEFRVTGKPDELKAVMVKVQERTAVLLENFISELS